MKTSLSSILSNVYVLPVTLILCGCATSPSPRLYLLRTREDVNVTASADAPTLIVCPVEIADYLDRPQIIIRKDRREIAQAQFDRWAEPLDKQINLYLASTLANNLKDFNVKCFLLNEEDEARYEVEIAILTFDGTPGGSVKLDAKWKICSTGEHRRTLKDGRIQSFKACPAPGIPGIVAATELLLDDLGKAISDELKGCR